MAIIDADEHLFRSNSLDKVISSSPSPTSPPSLAFLLTHSSGS